MNDRDYVYKIILSDCQTVKIWEKMIFNAIR